MLALHKSSRPASSYERKKNSTAKKKRKFYKKPEFYAILLAAIGILLVVAIGILTAGVSQATDINSLIELAQDEGNQNVAELGGIDSGWFDFLVLVQSNLTSIMLGVIGFFMFSAAMVLVFANMYRNSKSRAEGNTPTADNSKTTHNK